MRNLLIAANAIGDIILSSELIKNAEHRNWLVYVHPNHYEWVKKYILKEDSCNLVSNLNLEIDYDIIVDACGQDSVLCDLKKVNKKKSIGFFFHTFYDEVIDFSTKCSVNPVYDFYKTINYTLFTKSNYSDYPAFSKKTDYTKKFDVVIYPFSGNPKKNWPISFFTKTYVLLKENGFDVKFLNPIPCGIEIENVASYDILTPKDWIESSSVIKSSRLFLANDSSLAHISAFLGIFTVAIFNKFNSKIWFPYPKNIGVAIDNLDQNLFANDLYQKLVTYLYEYEI